MKIVVLADIHGNLPALETVVKDIERWQPDRVVVAGDIVNRGPRPRECLELVLQKHEREGWLVIRGNHEDYVISSANPEMFLSKPAFEIYRSAYWTYQQIGDVSVLEAMPEQVDVTAPDGQVVQVFHASVHSNRDGIFPRTSDEQLRRKIHLPDQPLPAVFCTGHTHWPLIRFIEETIVVNVGSVGLPFDGDYRACYARLVWNDGQWGPEIVRLDYDRQQTERDFYETGYYPEGGPLVKLIIDELRIARPHLFKWTHQYQDAILAGEIDIEEAVCNYLADRQAASS